MDRIRYNSGIRDALVDLRDAGFSGEQIQVAYASECAKISKVDHTVASEHRFFWKLRRTRRQCDRRTLATRRYPR